MQLLPADRWRALRDRLVDPEICAGARSVPELIGLARLPNLSVRFTVTVVGVTRKRKNSFKFKVLSCVAQALLGQGVGEAWCRHL
ncbi:MAG: hypothetical protein IPF94_20255 [Betaproteobacteria bacterium]|nr:hypothetical protein [Betaproteobacteria bacterium]